MTVKFFIASTLDGYIATKEESLQWLFDVEGEGDNGYGTFYSGIDTIIMGKKTYDWLEKEQAGQWPYSDKRPRIFQLIKKFLLLTISFLLTKKN